MTSRNLSPAEIRKKIEALGPWFHNLDLNGISTAPSHFLGNYPAIKWERFADAIPQDMSGRSVLDIGCNAGFYAIEMKRRGAARVLGIDTDEEYLAQARFAAQVNALDIEFSRMSVYDIGALGEKFDMVLFLGVLYHLRHPLFALDLIYEYVANDILLFQSMQRGGTEIGVLNENYDFWATDAFNRDDFPKMHFIEHRFAGDWTNWWIPNRACVEAMLRSAGFTVIGHPEQEVYICRRAERPYAAEMVGSIGGGAND